MTIQVLDQTVASLIAAGEVVERPASVVKELVENALDAGATRVAVEARGGGAALLRVTDNGCGIPQEEVALAFQRHATSKVRSATDLEEIQTLGFRGEALPSIAAVAEVSILTRIPEAAAGSFLQIAFGRLQEQGHRGCPPGTTLTVRRLFAEVPARAKFLRSQTTEVGRISDLLTHYALAYPEVQFTLQVEGREAFRSPGSGHLQEAMIAVYGLETARAMLAIAPAPAGPGEGAESQTVKVSGFVSPPTVHRGNRGQLSFFVNRRWVQNRVLTYAAEEAYQGFLMSGRHPLGVLNVDLPPREVDVNVHPAKIEVKFLNERVVFAAIQRAVRTALLAEAPVPTFVPRPGEPRPGVDQPRMSVFQVGGWDTQPPNVDRDATTADVPLLAPRLPVLRVLGQVGGTYIIAEGPDGMFLIDQHAAHERIMYEKILKQRRQQKVESQGLLEPQPVEVPLPQAQVVAERLSELTEFGFVVEHFGERTYLIRAVPTVINGADAANTFLNAVDSLAEEGHGEDRSDGLAMVLACHSAVRAGQILTLEEMRELLRDLEETALPNTCPHGRPTMIHLSSSQLEREFGRR